MKTLLLFLTALVIIGCSVEDLQDCYKIQTIDVKPSGHYLLLENNVVIHISDTSQEYKVGEYYCFK